MMASDVFVLLFCFTKWSRET